MKNNITHSLSNNLQKFIYLCGFICFFILSNTLLAQHLSIDSLHNSYRQSNEPNKKNLLLSQIAMQLSRFNPDSAITISQQAITEAKEMAFNEGIANGYSSLGWSYAQKGENQKGIENINRAIALFKKQNGPTESLLRAYVSISSIFIQTEDYTEGLRYLLAALPYAKGEENLIETPYIYRNLAIIYRNLEEYPKSIEYFNKSIQLNLKNNDKLFAAATQLSLGILYLNIEKPKDALKEFEKTFNLHLEDGDKKGMGLALENMGYAYLDLHENKKALNSFLSAQKLYQEVKSLDDLAYTSLNIGKTYSAMGDYNQAIIHLNEALKAEETIHLPSFKMDVLNQLAITYEKQGNYQKALTYTQEFQELKDSLQVSDQVNELNRLRTEFETEQKNKEIAILNSEKALAKEKSFNQLIIAIVLILLTISIAVVLYIRTQLIKKEKILIDQEKIMAIQAQKDTEQKLLRSQMNPHFIFNCLNTIDSFILQNKQIEASRLVQRFSKLSRQVLEFTTRDFITIQESAGMLKVYLQIQQTRSSNEFEFEMNVAENIGTYLTTPMLIQPFVENALVHGIRNREEKGGKIIVSFQIENEKNILVSVSDNGVGRAKAAEINLTKNKSHHSKAMEITQARLASLNNNIPPDEYLIFIDHEAPETGTTVLVRFPIIQS